MKLTKLFKDFSESEKTGGIILIICTLLSLLLTNSTLVGDSYTQFWQFEIAEHSLSHWINDGLMTIFFLLIGLELEREIYIGELSKIKDAILPIAGALGGMLVPAAIFLLFNFKTPYQNGAGIPMATDIAFALGVLSLLGSRVPASLKVFLTALAVIDDLGAIIVIAVFYTKTLDWSNLLIAFSIFALLLAFNRLKVHNLIPYLIGGVAIWYFMLHSGVHATITGVLLAFAIPFGDGSEKSPSYILQHWLHKPVAFLILPFFAMANTAILFTNDMAHVFSHSNGIGISIGLLVGKPLGITLLTFTAVSLKIGKLPNELQWNNILGAGILAGIGFTMSIFITLLAFDDELIINHSKFVILSASTLAGLFGYFFLKFTLPKHTKQLIDEN